MLSKPEDSAMKALIIYEDFNAAVKAIAALQRAAHQGNATLEWDIWAWRVLKFPLIAAEALMGARDAHLLVLAGGRTRSLPVWLPDWLEQWARHRHIKDAALAVIGEGNDHAFSAPAQRQLSGFAQRHGLSFIIDHRTEVKDIDLLRPQPEGTRGSLPQFIEVPVVTQRSTRERRR
jgi:hypothetical protein